MQQQSRSEAIAAIENTGLTRSHIRIMLISGMSFFTDAYDLFVIGVVLLMVRVPFNLSTTQLGMLASIALFGAAIGPMIFGYIGDKLGRKYTYWLTIVILMVAALGSAFSSGFIELFLWRLALGIGIGGDYPLSATIVAEYANKNDRGKLISSTFAMQGFGIIAGALLAVLLLSLHVPTTMAWRVLLAAGAVPTFTILYARTKLAETPWYSLYKNGSGNAKSGAAPHKHPTPKSSDFRIGFNALWRSNWKYMVGTTAAWFLLDMSYYGTSIFTPYLTTFLGFSGIFGPTLASALILMIAAVPGYWVAVALIDREGRKPMQAIGFVMMAALFIALFFFGSALLKLLPFAFFSIYAMTFFFSNYGPNTTTYVYPAELYPTQYRARGHGLAASIGKLGAAISTLIFPLLLITIGKFNLLGLLGVIALVGFAVTMLFLPETKRRSLSETSGELEITLVTEDMYSEFESMQRNISAGVALIKSRLSGKINNQDLFSRVKEREHKCDIVVHEVLDVMANSKLNASVYRDISHMVERLDDVMDGIEAVAARFSIYNIKRTEPRMREMMDVTESCIDYMMENINLLSSVQSNTTVPSRIKKNAIEAAAKENRADEIVRIALSNIMRNDDFRHVIAYKELYERMEAISDRCMDVIDVVNDIVIRHLQDTMPGRRYRRPIV